MNRDEYIEHLRERLKIAEAIIEKATKQPSVGWQFLENGEWHQGSMLNNHRRNTEEAGYPVRDVYVGPVMSASVAKQVVMPELWQSAVNNVAGYAHLFNSGCGIISEIRAEHARLNAADQEAIAVELAKEQP